ncbi:19101_t:CDS:2, partial [Racocetra fulgida]
NERQDGKIEIKDPSEYSLKGIDMEFDLDDEQLLETLRKLCPTLYGICEECQQPNTGESWCLKNIHERNLIHQDLHGGNIVMRSKTLSTITDFGLCKPVDYYETLENSQKIYGIIPYMAPEVLR